MTDEPRSIESVLEQAIDLPEVEREAFVRQAFAEDPESCQETLSLLEAYFNADDFMEQGITVSPLTDDGEDPWVGQTLGGYELVESIGVGGMGRVYLARRVDRDFEQIVAVKVIRRSVMGREVLRRFRNECQVLARLEHPNIARMIDGGTADDGTPYIVMEYVDGIPIDQYCVERGTSLKDCLQLFRKVCHAVHVVHQHSTIHRDIKPGNILVTDDGTVKLVDFGIARALDVAAEPADLTATGFEVMTPGYASPEQLRGESLSTATDIFSLGAVLYKMLTGHAPFADTHYRQRTTGTHTVERPSQIITTKGWTGSDEQRKRRTRNLRGDLDTIVLMALRPEPDRRYASAEKFAEDIDRYLTGKTVSARPDTLGYRVEKFVRRNPAAVAASLLLVVVLIGSTALSLSLLARATASREVAEARGEELEREVATSQATLDFVKDMLGAADPSQDGREVRVVDLLEPALESGQERYRDRPEIAAGIAAIVGETYTGLGLYEDAAEVFKQNYETQRATLGPDDPETWWALNVWGASLGDAVDDFALPDSLLHAALEGLRATLGPEHDHTLDCENSLGLHLTFAGKYDEAEQLLTEALDLRQRYFGEDHEETLTVMNNLGLLYLSTERYTDAEPLLVQAVDGLTRILGPEHPGILVAYSNLVILYYNLGDLEKTEHYAQIAWEAQNRILGPEHPDTLKALNNLASVQRRKGDLQAAASSFARMMSSNAGENPDTSLIFSTGRGNYGELLTELERFDEARPLLLNSYEGFLDLLGSEDRRVQRAIDRLVTLYEASGNEEEAALWRGQKVE